jgi:hypothetical protein
MKKTFLILTFFCFFSITAQKKKDLIYSNNIDEIESFLKTAHPEDPRRTVLKPKLIALKNAAWMKPGANKKYMVQANVVQIPKDILKLKENDEAEEFKKLMADTQDIKKDKTVKLLNQLFTDQLDSKEAILLFQNKSDCNVVLRIEGKDFYNLAVPAKGENTLVLKKGNYHLSANVCNVKYFSEKSIMKHTMISLNEPVLQVSNKEIAASNGISSF